MPSRKAAFSGTLALALGLTPLQPVAATPMAPLPPGLAKAEAGGVVTEVRRNRSHGRHGHHHHHHHHRHRGRNLAIGLGIGIIGGIIASEAYGSAPGYYEDEVYDVPPDSGDPRALCAQTFRSFEWNTGLYTTYAGEKRPCPYLR